MKRELTITKKSFKAEDGRVKQYYSFEFEFDGKTFSLLPRQDDKKLLNYLIDKSGEIK